MNSPDGRKVNKNELGVGWASLRESALRMREPADYFRGPSWDEASALPRRVVWFCRHSAAGLCHGRGGRARLHHHHRYVMIVPLEGRGAVLVDRLLLPGGPGRALLLQPYQFHHYARLEEPLRWLFITFGAGAEGPWARWRGAWAPLADEDYAALGRVVGAGEGPARGWAAAYELAAVLVRATERVRGAAVGERSPLLGRINAAIDALPPVQRTGAAVAQRLGHSAAHLRRVFLAETGTGLGHYLVQRRLTAAMEVLRVPGARVSDAAAAAGYASLYSFSRSFRRVVGQPPRLWRKGEQTTRL